MAKKVKQLRATIIASTNDCFQLTFMPERNKLLPQSLDYTLCRRKKSFFLILYIAHFIFPHFTLFFFFFSPLFLSLKPVDDLILCTFSVLEAIKKNKEVPKYILFWKISIIPET